MNWGLHHMTVEGLAIFLAQRGAGRGAALRATRFGLAWFTFCTSVFYAYYTVSDRIGCTARASMGAGAGGLAGGRVPRD